MDLRHLRSYVAPDQFKPSLFLTHVTLPSSGPTQCAATQYVSARELLRKSIHWRNEDDDVSGRRSFPKTHWLEDALSAWAFDAKKERVRKRDDELPTTDRHERYVRPPPGAACVQLRRRPLVCSAVSDTPSISSVASLELRPNRLAVRL
jgi:hypothetical protein